MYIRIGIHQRAFKHHLTQEQIITAVETGSRGTPVWVKTEPMETHSIRVPSALWA